MSINWTFFPRKKTPSELIETISVFNKREKVK